MSIKSSELAKGAVKALQQPLQLGPIQLSNRVVMASLTRSRGLPDDRANTWAVDYYTQRAGAGLVLSEGTLVSPQGTEWPNVISIYSEEHAVAWKRVTDSVHQAGGRMFAQLWHVGRVAHPDMPLQRKFGPVSAASPISARGGRFVLLDKDSTYVKPEREHPNPRELVEEFRQAAKLAKQAGFDGVELHDANGYLMVQFLDKSSNHRTDEWGGSLENRLRLSRETLAALIEVFGADRVGIKLNPAGGAHALKMT